MTERIQIDLDELKNIQLAILEYVDQFCKTNGIKYWIDCGTLLGAIRHKGYIPWDDDIDIGMLRPDYDRFMHSFPRKGRYRFGCVEQDSHYQYAFGKVMDTQTQLFEPDEKGKKSCVYIDVFVYDNAPDDDTLLKSQYAERDRYNNRYLYRTRQFTESHPIKHAIKTGIYYLMQVIPNDYYLKKIIANSKRYADQDTKRVGNFTAFDHMVCDKSVFREFVDVEFEGRHFPVPVGYDQWLRAFYKDYMQLPPVEKRVNKHQFVAYKLK